ncbi:MAG: ferritin [Gemmatimonadota bacterium]
MSIGAVMQDAMNQQVKHEFFSAYTYLSMAAYLESIHLPGSAHWMRVQAREEVKHAMKFFEHIIDRGGRVQLQPIDGPHVDFASPLDVFSKALEHERFITGRINALYAVAQQEQDFAAEGLLDWFVKEQVEEEKTVGQVVEDFRMVGDNRSALLLLDRELGARSAESDDEGDEA